MNQPTLLGKLLSPAGFGLVLLFFLLPFVAVSCGPDQNTQVTAQFTGMDMIVAGEPDISGTGIGPDEADAVNVLFADQYDSEPLAILAALVLLGAMATALVRERLARHSAGVGLAVLATALIVAAELRAMYRLEHVDMTDITGATERLDPGAATTRYGFWLALAVLAALAVGHGLILVRAWRHPAPAGPPLDPVPSEPFDVDQYPFEVEGEGEPTVRHEPDR